jgi:hypothetical protein
MNDCKLLPYRHNLRAAFEEHHGRKIPTGYHLGHICGHTTCGNLDHLRVQTPQENSRELLHRRGEKLFTEEQLWGTHLRWLADQDLPVIPTKARKPYVTARAQWRELGLIFVLREVA